MALFQLIFTLKKAVCVVLECPKLLWWTRFAPDFNSSGPYSDKKSDVMGVGGPVIKSLRTTELN